MLIEYRMMLISEEKAIGLEREEQEELSGAIRTFCILIWMEVIHVNTYVKTHSALIFKFPHFTTHTLEFNKKEKFIYNCGGIR